MRGLRHDGLVADDLHVAAQDGLLPLQARERAQVALAIRLAPLDRLLAVGGEDRGVVGEFIEELGKAFVERGDRSIETRVNFFFELLRAHVASLLLP
jgi:hypothetical protein